MKSLCISGIIAKMHRGIYLESNGVSGANTDNTEVSFVRDHLVDIYEGITTNVIFRLPTKCANTIASTVAIFSIYYFVSNPTPSSSDPWEKRDASASPKTLPTS